MTRVLTAAVGAPLALAAVLWLPRVPLFVLLLVVFEIAAWEFVRVARVWAPAAPNGMLLLLVPVAALLLTPEMLGGGEVSFEHLFGMALLVGVGAASTVLLCRAPVDQALTGMGILAFGSAYFALPVASLDLLRRIDPWLVVLLLAIVWLGDTAAYYTGRYLGRHKLAPVASPNKTWEGAAGALVAACAAAAVWSSLRLGMVSWELIALAAGTSVAAQIGDLAESAIKRGTGVKDSGGLLPGHGGMWDRLDSLIFAAPVLALGFWVFHF